MREILFRGKDKDTGEWIEGLPYIYHNGSVSIAEVGQNFHVYYEIQFDEVDPSTLGQYIGLTDKNGKKIFEGDIVRNGYSSSLGEFWEKGNVVYVSTDGCFEICNFGNAYLKRLTQTQIVKRSIEVIGNIHDNGELINEN